MNPLQCVGGNFNFHPLRNELLLPDQRQWNRSSSNIGKLSGPYPIVTDARGWLAAKLVWLE